jgi:molybdopterin-binding protein
VSAPRGLPRFEAPVTAVAGPAAADLLRAAGAGPGVALVDAAARLPRWRTTRGLLARAARRGGGGRPAVERLVEALGLRPLLGLGLGELAAVPRRQVLLAAGLLARRPLLVLAGTAGDPAALRRATWTLLRWARDAFDQRIAYEVQGTRELEDLADRLMVATADGVHGPGEPWDLLGRTLRGGFAADFLVESLLRASVDYLDEEGRWLRVLVGGQVAYLPFERLSPGQIGQVAIRPESLLVLREELGGTRLTNQLRGRVRGLGDLLGRCRVDVELGPRAVIRAAVEPDTVRGLGLAPGAEVVCAFEPAALRWIG